MTTVRFGATAIAIPAAPAPFVCGDRVCYVPPAGTATTVTTGTLRAVSGVSALVRWDALGWVGGVPVARLVKESEGA